MTAVAAAAATLCGPHKLIHSSFEGKPGRGGEMTTMFFFLLLHLCWLHHSFLCPHFLGFGLHIAAAAAVTEYNKPADAADEKLRETKKGGWKQ